MKGANCNGAREKFARKKKKRFIGKEVLRKVNKDQRNRAASSRQGREFRSRGGRNVETESWCKYKKPSMTGTLIFRGEGPKRAPHHMKAEHRRLLSREKKKKRRKDRDIKRKEVEASSKKPRGLPAKGTVDNGTGEGLQR